MIRFDPGEDVQKRRYDDVACCSVALYSFCMLYAMAWLLNDFVIPYSVPAAHLDMKGELELSDGNTERESWGVARMLGKSIRDRVYLVRRTCINSIRIWMSGVR